MDALQKIDAIRRWQTRPDVHPLTCGNLSSHAPLVPALEPNGGMVVLLCMNCDYMQTKIPEVVYGPPERPAFTRDHAAQEAAYDVYDAVRALNEAVEVAAAEGLTVQARTTDMETLGRAPFPYTTVEVLKRIPEQESD